jgi:chromosome segregation ATPase
MLQENEMREFFNRIIGDFTGLTEAANKVEGLSQRVQELSDRISALENENVSLKGEVKEAWEYARTVEDRADSLQSSLNDSQASAKALQETIVASDSRVAELTRSLDSSLNSQQTVERDRDEARNSVKDYEVLTADLRNQLAETEADRNTWKDVAQRHEATIKSLNETVSRVQSILNPPSNVEPFPQFNVG